MRYLTEIFAIALLISSTSHSEDADGQLDIEFDTATAIVSPRTSNRPINLPTLTFTFRAQAQCPAAEAPESISVSIADTRITIYPDSDSNDVIEKSIRVSQKQLGPVAVANFCLAENDADVGELLELDDALSAQLSLRCVGENSESISYQTAALSVSLLCEVTALPSATANQ